MDNRQYPESNDPIFDGDSEIGRVGHIFGQKDGGWDVQVVGSNGAEQQDHLIVVGESVVDKDTNQHSHYRTVTQAHAERVKEEAEQKKAEAAAPKSDTPAEVNDQAPAGGSAFENAFGAGQS